jgi:spermidine synthase
MDEIMEGWFSEISPMWKGVALSIEIEETLFSERTPYQKIEVFKTRTCGNMLVLDGIIQATEMDEFAYQEMMAHLPMFAHPAPRNVLVVGGGDGGVLRELAKHETVERMDICEIDETVIEVSKKWLSGMAVGYDDPRVEVIVADGMEYVESVSEKYDVIVVDSSDPIGPGEALFQKPFYEALKGALKPGGIVSTQAESFFLHPGVAGPLMALARSLFPRAGYAYMLVPTYPGGNIGACVASLGRDPITPCRKPSKEVQKTLRYYNPAIHEASFVLPENGSRLFGS